MHAHARKRYCVFICWEERIYIYALIELFLFRTRARTKSAQQASIYAAPLCGFKIIESGNRSFFLGLLISERCNFQARFVAESDSQKFLMRGFSAL